MSRTEQVEFTDIRQLTAVDAVGFRTLRLDALREFPESFGTTWEEERDSPWAEFSQRYRADWTAGDNCIFGAFMHGQLVGAIGLRRWNRAKQQHKAYIWILYVDAAARRTGVGRRLFEAALDYARALPGLQQIQLSVSTDSPGARSLYVSFGFESFGYERHSLKLAEKFIDLELMVLHLT